MRYRKEMLMTVGTLSCAIGIGFFMQKSPSVTSPTPEHQGAVLINADAAILDVEEIILTSAEFADDSVTPQAEADVTFAAAHKVIQPQTDIAPSAPMASDMTAEEAACEITANARPIAAAMVNLRVSADCLPNERVTVHHSGLLFNELTDANGALDIIVPAMAAEATFVVAFNNGEGAVAQAVVDELGEYDRVALQWKGDTGFELHAREFGADYGDEGHVWSGAARDLSFAVTGQGGYISTLGNERVADGLMAEVYTFPANPLQNPSNVDLSVETEVAKNNCGLEIEAQTLQTKSGNDITSRDLTLSVPDCDAAGNFLVLNNLLEDLKVASN